MTLKPITNRKARNINKTKDSQVNSWLSFFVNEELSLTDGQAVLDTVKRREGEGGRLAGHVHYQEYRKQH